MRKLLLSALFTASLATGAMAEDVRVEGCTTAGVEAGCVMLEANGTKYDVTAATPKPDVGTYGTVSGVISTGTGICQEGTRLDPATWTPDPSKVCPLAQ